MNPIKVDPEIMGSKPCFAGTRVPIQNLFDLLAHNRSLDYFLQQYPSVSRQQARTVLELAGEKLSDVAVSAA